MPDNFHRLVRLMQLVPRHPRFIDTETIERMLADEGMPTTRRTIQRDLLRLERMGFGLERVDDNKPYRWRFNAAAATLVVPVLDPSKGN